MSKGYMRISRDKLSSWCWRGNMNKNYLMMFLLVNANFKSERFEKIIVERGQYVFSYDGLSRDCGMPLQTLRTTLKDLVKTNQITIKSTRKWSLLTICEYDSWQIQDNETNTQLVTQTGTQVVTQMDNNIINKEINNKEKKDATASLQLEFEEHEIKSKVSDFDFDAFLDYFNKTLKANNSIIPSLRKIDERRKNVIHARIKDYGTDAIYEVVQKASVSSFMNGGGSKGWKANFDWMFGPDNFRKVLEGNYDDMDTKKPNVIGNYGFSGLQFPKDPRHGDIFNNHYYDANEDRWIADGEKDRLGRVFSIQMKKWLI